MNLVKEPKQCFVVLAALSCLTSYAKPDYNLPLFGFAYLMWDVDNAEEDSENKEDAQQRDKIQPQRLRFFYLIVFSWFADALWIITWRKRNEKKKNYKFH